MRHEGRAYNTISVSCVLHLPRFGLIPASTIVVCILTKFVGARDEVFGGATGVFQIQRETILDWVCTFQIVHFDCIYVTLLGGHYR